MEKIVSSGIPLPTRGGGYVNPLIVFIAFISLVEIMSSVALINTDGNVQIILAVFAVSFPLVILLVFSVLLWFKFEVLFAPADFPAHLKPSEYFTAMRSMRSPKAAPDQIVQKARTEVIKEIIVSSKMS